MRLTRTFVLSFLLASTLIHAIYCDEITDSIARNDRSLASRLTRDSGTVSSLNKTCGVNVKSGVESKAKDATCKSDELLWVNDDVF